MRYLKTYQKFEAVQAKPTDEEVEAFFLELSRIANEEGIPADKIPAAQDLAEEIIESPKQVNEEIIGVGLGVLMIAGVVGLLGCAIKGVVSQEFKNYAKRRAEDQITLLEKSPEFKGDRKELIKAAYKKLKADPEFKKKYEEEQAKYSGKGGASRQVGG